MLSGDKQDAAAPVGGFLGESLLYLALNRGLTGRILELRFHDFAGAEATGADADGLGRAIHLCADWTQVNVPAPFSHVVRVRNVVARHRLLAANRTNLCHDFLCILQSSVRKT